MGFWKAVGKVISAPFKAVGNALEIKSRVTPEIIQRLQVIAALLVLIVMGCAVFSTSVRSLSWLMVAAISTAVIIERKVSTQTKVKRSDRSPVFETRDSVFMHAIHEMMTQELMASMAEEINALRTEKMNEQRKLSDKTQVEYGKTQDTTYCSCIHIIH